MQALAAYLRKDCREKVCYFRCRLSSRLGPHFWWNGTGVVPHRTFRGLGIRKDEPVDLHPPALEEH